LADYGNIITAGQLLRDLERGRVEPCYFFFGPEDVLVDRALARLKQAALDPAAADFNWDVFRADDDEVNWVAFSDALNSLPLMAARRVVVLKRAGKAGQVKSVAGLIERAVESPSPDRILVLIDPDLDLKKPKAFHKKLLERCVAVEFAHPKPAELQRHLRDFAVGFGKEIEEEALSRILTDSSPGLRDLLSKLEVLVFYVGDKPVIEARDVEACSVFSREVEIFKLLEALGRRDPTMTRLTLGQLLQRRADTGGLIHLLYRQVWALYRMKYLQEKSVPPGQWQAQLNLKPAFLERRYREYLPNYTRRELGLSLEILAQVDLTRKTLAVDDQQVFWTMTERLLNPAGRAKQE